MIISLCNTCFPSLLDNSQNPSRKYPGQSPCHERECGWWGAEEERGKCWRWGWWATGSFSYSTNASLWLYLHWEIIWLMTSPCILWVRSTGVIILSHSRSDHSANLDNSTFKNIFTNTTASPLVWATFLWLREPPPGRASGLICCLPSPIPKLPTV